MLTIIPPFPQADVTMEGAPTQCKTELRQLEGLGTLSSPDQMKEVFTEIVIGERVSSWRNVPSDAFPLKRTTKPMNGWGTFTATLRFTTWHSIATRGR